MSFGAVKNSINNFFEFIYKYRIVLAFLLFFILVLFKFHGSSIGIYNNYIQTGSNTSVFANPIIGKNQPIRSDEYGIQTPIMLSQKYVNYSIDNNIIRADKTNVAAICSQPVKALYTIVKPSYWGYVLFGSEYGLSWFWNEKMIFLFLVTFEFLQIITRKRRLISLLGAFLVTYSPSVQWWFITDLADEIMFCELGIITIHHFLSTERHLIKGLLSVVLGLCAAGFTLCLYPAWMVPFTYAFLSILIGLIIANKDSYKFHKTDILYLLIAIMIGIMIVLSLLLPSKEAIEAISNTVHPGKRVDLGGIYLLQLFYYLINHNVYPYNNECELSHFIGLFPLPAIIASVYLYKTKFKDKLLICLLCAQLVIVSYLVIGFHPLLAQITGFSMTTHRAVMVSSFIDIVLLIRLLSNSEEIKIPHKLLISFVYTIIVFVMVMIIKNATLETNPNMVQNIWTNIYPFVISLIAFIVSQIVLYSVEKESKLKTCTIILTMVLSFLCFSLINPLVHGLDTVYKIPVGAEINKIQTEHPGRWLVIDTYPLTNFPVMFGAPTINSTNTYPNLKLWHLIDEDGQYEDVYNRYCNISTILLLKSQTSVFETVLPETIVLYLSFYDLPKIRVNYIFSTIMTGQYVKFPNGVEFIPLYYENGATIYLVNYTGESLKVYNEYKNQIL